MLVWGREVKMRLNYILVRVGEEGTAKSIFSHRWLKRNTENRPQHLVLLADCREGKAC